MAQHQHPALECACNRLCWISVPFFHALFHSKHAYFHGNLTATKFKRLDSKLFPTIKEILMLFLVSVSHKWVQIQHRPTLFAEIISMVKAN